MSDLRKRPSVSMFRWYFLQTSVSVILCLAVSMLAIWIFFVDFWKADRLTALNEDALSVSRGVELFFETRDADAEDMPAAAEYIQSMISAIAQYSDIEIFVVNKTGDVIYCSASSDKIDADDGACSLHGNISFPEKLIEQIIFSEDEEYRYTGKIDGISDEIYLLGAVPFDLQNETACVITMKSAVEAFLPYASRFLRMFILSSVLVMAISCLLSVIVSYRMVRPIKKVIQVTKHYAGGDFSARINTTQVYMELTQLAESVNRMADNLAVLEESRSSFIANVSHELKTPMTIISGFVDGMLDGTIPYEDSEKYLTIVSDEVKRLSRLVVSMLNMSKIEAGKLTLNKSVFSFSDVVLKTALGFEKIVENKNIQISGLDELSDIMINADEVLITQVVYNLFDNAVKFVNESGRITLSLYTEKNEAVFAVENTGIGISKAEKELIFDRFYKVDKSRGLDAKSFGMGLYIVKSIIDLHNGTISLESNEQEYTKFIVRLSL